MAMRTSRQASGAFAWPSGNGAEKYVSIGLTCRIVNTRSCTRLKDHSAAEMPFSQGGLKRKCSPQLGIQGDHRLANESFINYGYFLVLLSCRLRGHSFP